MTEYGANLIGEHIREASQEQVFAIEAASNRQVEATKRMSQAQSQAIRQAAESIGFTIRNEMSFLNKRLDISLEQQRLSLMLQKNISELLMIPDSEKERQQAITLGIQFFVNASKDPDLFDDALEEFLKAEQMKKQDYFVLHRIGCIYLYVEKHLNPQLAFDYFVRAGKYAAVESSPDALRLANLLTNPINADYTQQTSDPKQIMQLAADSYGKAALASYILGDNDNAVSYQQKALKYDKSARNGFTLAKYLIRSGNTEQAMKTLERAIDKDPQMMDAIFCDVDVAGDPRTIELVDRKKSELENSLEETILESFDIVPSEDDYSTLRYNEIATLEDKDTFLNKANALSAFKNYTFEPTITGLKKERLSLIDRLRHLKDDGLISVPDYDTYYDLLWKGGQTVEVAHELFSKVRAFLSDVVVKVGDKLAGGVIIDVDSTGRRGLMCSNQVIGPSPLFGYEEDTNPEWVFMYFWLRGNQVVRDFREANVNDIPEDPHFHQNAVELCKNYSAGGHHDWYLPSNNELEIVYSFAPDIVKGFEIWSASVMVSKSNSPGLNDLCGYYYSEEGDKTKQSLINSFSYTFKWCNQQQRYILPIRKFDLDNLDNNG